MPKMTLFVRHAKWEGRSTKKKKRVPNCHKINNIKEISVYCVIKIENGAESHEDSKNAKECEEEGPCVDPHHQNNKNKRNCGELEIFEYL